MSEPKKIRTPLEREDVAKLKAGDEVLLSGVIYTARDQAHLRLAEMIKKHQQLPIVLDKQVIYYCGPAPRGKGVIGSCGPTTSSRMDAFTPAILEKGLKGMVGKGSRSKQVEAEIKRFSAVYFIAPAGAGAYLSYRVTSCEMVAFEDLGPEAIYRLEVEDFPLVVAVDSEGGSIY
ncbi:MAG: FumA C-terminus/TtdB family hydratase beta subunit [Candidatus Omnitrophota bacterium]